MNRITCIDQVKQIHENELSLGERLRLSWGYASSGVVAISAASSFHFYSPWDVKINKNVTIL